MTHKTLTVAVISPEHQIREQIAFSLEDNPDLEAIWTLAEYPGSAQLSRIRQARSGCVVFLDFADPVRAAMVAEELDRSYPMAVTVAVATTGPQDLLALMQLGIREVIAVPVAAKEASEVIRRASRKLGHEVQPEPLSCEIHAFLPARPGSGATTIATHSAAAASRISGERILLIDFDLRLGMTSFLLKLHSQYSVMDALVFSNRLEEVLWDQMVCDRDGLDILGSAPIEFDRQIPEGGAAALLEFAKRKYRHICVDLPGEMREHELETLNRSKQIFLVCTCEVGTLHMARRKAELLQSLGIQSRISVILNNAQWRGSMAIGDIEEVLGLPVQFTLPPAEDEIMEATHKAAVLEGNSPVATAIERIARRITGITAADMEAARLKPKPRRLIEFFSVTPIRDKVRRGR